MAVTEVAHLFHAPPSTSNRTVLLLHARSPILHFHCRPISVSDHRFLLFRQRSLHIRRCRRWDSNAEIYSSRNSNSEDSDETENLDGEMEQWVEALDDYIDSIWIFKVFGSYGWMLPPIIISLLLVNGPKAFLLALSLPILQSTFAFAIERFQNRGKRRSRVRRSKQKGKAKRRRSPIYGSRDAAFEDSPEFTYRRGTGKKRRGYESWFSKDGGSHGRSSGDFGGWDELDSETDRNVGGFSRRGFEKSRGTSRQKVEGAAELYQYLESKNIRRGLITRNVKDAVDLFHKRFAITFSPALSREFRPYKPDPAPLLHICSNWEVQPHEVMMVGDSLKDDVACGKRAGAFACLLDETGRYNSPEFQNVEFKPDYKVSSLSELHSLLEKNFNLSA